VCRAARRRAQINSERAKGASGAAPDAADDLAASIQLGRVSGWVWGPVMNRMILVRAMNAATIAKGPWRGPRRQPPAARARFGSTSKRARAIAAWRLGGASTTRFRGESGTLAPSRRTRRRIARPFSDLTRWCLRGRRPRPF